MGKKNHSQRSNPSRGSACESWLESITLFIDDEISDEGRRSLERHLVSCSACRDAVELRRNMRCNWQEALSLPSHPRDRSAIVQMAREQAQRAGVGFWKSLAGWPQRGKGVPSPVNFADLITGTAVAASILLVVYLGHWRKVTRTSSWRDSSPAVFYPGSGLTEKQIVPVDSGSDPARLPRPF
ncbi:MAG: zf-HC2 domain-containing protein [Candidatus Krumholzibacteria bacterium]|nr:zf-HC2 domain-containing protein [Candidatus Krumholzibacteria bacterium]